MTGTGTRIHITTPRTVLGRVIAGVLGIAAVLLFLFFFAALLIVFAVGVAGFFIWSAFRKKKQSKVSADELPVEYEVVHEPEPAQLPAGGPLTSGDSEMNPRIQPSAEPSESKI